MMNVEPGLALVAGGSGYFGSLLVRRLRQEGQRVRVFDLTDADDRPEGVEFQRGDIRDPDACRRACAGAMTVYHCVAQVPLARDSSLFWSVNRDGTRNLLEAARTAGARKVIYISSSAVFGVPRDAPITRATQPLPAEPYGAAKLAAEAICRELAAEGLDVAIIRPRTILGHGRLGIMQIVFEWVHRGRDVFVLGRGANLYQFVHADDLAEACLLAARRPGFAVYHIGAERFDTMRETLEGLTRYAGTGSRVRSLPRRSAVAAMRLSNWLRISPLAPYHWLVYGQDVYFDVTEARQELGWRSNWSNIDMLVQSYEWYVANRGRILAEKGRSAHRSPVRQGILKVLNWM
jgi:nucleoside-diphosphate-sugar epimerase